MNASSKEYVTRYLRGEMFDWELIEAIPDSSELVASFRFVVDELEHELTKLAKPTDTNAQRILNSIKSKQ
jgi:hypothetical protein